MMIYSTISTISDKNYILYSDNLFGRFESFVTLVEIDCNILFRCMLQLI